MNFLLEEIDLFICNYNIAFSTKKGYRKSLLEFADFLSNKIQSNIEEVHLKKIYALYNKNGDFICYKPIDESLLEEYLHSLVNRGYNVVRLNKAALVSFFRFLYRNYDFPNIMSKISFETKFLKQLKKPIEVLSLHEALKLFHYIIMHSEQIERDTLLFVTFISTGCRVSEIRNIRVSDLQKEDNTIYINKTKSRKSKIVTLLPGMSDLIWDYCNTFGIHGNDHIFQLSYYQINTLFSNYLKKANLPIIKIHALRHSFATFMANSGTALSVIQQLLGHKNIITTEGYIHPNKVTNRNLKIIENEETFLYVAKKLKGKI